MLNKFCFPILLFFTITTPLEAKSQEQKNNAKSDEYLWLESIRENKSLNWVKAQNSQTVKSLNNTEIYKSSYQENIKLLTSQTRLPNIVQRGEYLYNFWQDTNHKLGIYRRTTLSDYMKKKPKWETVFDLDLLSSVEKTNWVYRGINCLQPNYNRCLLSLSPGGIDAVVVREFDIANKQFVNNGFHLKAAKSHVSWKDENTVFVTTDFGQDSLTHAGYPRIVKLWRRGTNINNAIKLFETPSSSLGVSMARFSDESSNIDIIQEVKSYHSSIYYTYKDGKTSKIPLPNSIELNAYMDGRLFFRLTNDWQFGDETFVQGSIIFSTVDNILAGKQHYELLIAPTETAIISAVNTTKSSLLVSLLNNVKPEIIRFYRTGNKWHSDKLTFDDIGTAFISSSNQSSDDFYISFSNYITPNTLYKYDHRQNELKLVKSEAPQFVSHDLEIKQHWATSKDGTKVPYFITMKKGLKLDGKNPTLMFAYGGFELPTTPYYSSILGSNWLEKGGVFVAANTRGGGEFGPKWHRAALTTQRHKAFEDFEAVAEDIIAKKITSPAYLGIEGQSNGGLLVAATAIRRPELYRAVLSQSPLLDMKRYSKLLAGSSWKAEYGDPDNEAIWNYIKTYSPFHNLEQSKNYPKFFFTASTNDDRVHPGHARKMVAKMQDMKHSVYYYEQLEGGHVSSINNTEQAKLYALIYAYLWEKLKDE
ncbi:hypothetical protein LCGC14_1217250 [marine sediment metagenome]|uniref:Peptidase S9 prolyl oligopeptidase catalytic domain-containing protein n=1 Tax=marine sediment metagenome TaxID=412755 RepID=A0A0F9NUM4_9ZZZZ